MMNYSITILICVMAEKALGSESACEPFLESQEGFMEEVLFKQSLEFCFLFPGTILPSPTHSKIYLE